ncbi:MAG: excinuclease ABC subunit UvrC [Clostridiales bacterium]|nr:excinuclease ABC subunit UvrC [Clostridiales bacterium]
MNGFDARLDLVPQEPGVYLMKDASGCVIYVGKAKKLRNRLRSYFGDHDIPNNKVRAMVSHVADFEYTVVGTEAEALLLEANLIKRYQPHYNILLRDDKGYPYVCITMNEAFPRVMKVFRPDEEARKKGALFFGPYMNGDLFVFLKAIDAIFPLKKCARKLPRDIGKERPCLNYHIGKCLAPCNGGINAEEYLAMMKMIVDFFEGRYDGIKAMIKEQMEKAAEAYDFEKASVYRDRLFALENITRNQKIFMDIRRDVDAVGIYSDAGESSIRKLELRDGRVVGSSTYFVKSEGSDNSEILQSFIMQYYENAPYIPETIVIPVSIGTEEETRDVEEYLSGLRGHKVTLKVPERGELMSLLKMADLNAREMMTRRILRGGGAGSDPEAAVRVIEKEFGIEEGSIKRIESFDISNLGNDDICAGMVVFTGGKADKQSYRLFKLKEVTTQDDFASMREVLTRRFSHSKEDGFTYPELILADGGKGQVSAILEVLTELGLQDKILLAGMFKNRKHKTAGLVFTDGREILLDKDNLNDDELVLLRFLTAVQNEVHRFAITYQRKLSKKRNLKYKLEDIKGIGPAKRKKLLAHFGTIKRISEATKEELLECPTITEENAISIIEHFSKE